MATKKNKPVGVVCRPGSFSDRWIQQLNDRRLDWVAIDPFLNNVTDSLRQISCLLWQTKTFSAIQRLAALHIINACRLMGIPSFPSVATYWSFDDKLAQKYQLEAIGAPLPETSVFFDRQSALHWLKTARFPLVHKLRCGAGSRNVSLVHDRAQAVRLVRRAFGAGFVASGGNVADAFNKLRAGKTSRSALISKLVRAPRTLWNLRALQRSIPRERGYIYFQEFISGNQHDTRITVIGRRAFGFRRRVRPHDFRASGSGDIDYDQSAIDPRCIEIAYRVADQLQLQSVCLDFVHDGQAKPKLIEISYGYVPETVYGAGGYWKPSLEYVRGAVWPQDAILDDLLAEVGD